MRVLFNVYLVGEVREFGQRQVTEIVHRSSQDRLCLASEMAQGGQMPQACNATCPDRLSTTNIVRLDKPLQVPHQGVGEPIQSKNQLVT